MHSYWDDFWALRGYRDAVQLARVLGHEEQAVRFDQWRAEFEQDLVTSIRAAARDHGIDYIPGAAELGDFDATSTTVALNPAQAEAILPPDLLAGTFERYWQQAEQRRLGQRDWKDYTPYELRNVGALLRLGHADRARTMLDYFFADQRPAGWRQWAEVVMREPRQVHFLGDMPHAWISSDYIRSALDLIAWERERDDARVLAAGIPDAWLRRRGVGVRGLSTVHGTLNAHVQRVGAEMRVRIDRGLRSVPRGGFVLPGRSEPWHPASLPASFSYMPDAALPGDADAPSHPAADGPSKAP